MEGTILHIRNLGLRLSDEFAVVIEALDLRAGERMVMDAVSGAGKSTALGLIAAGLPSAGLQGEVHLIKGRPVTADDPRQSFAAPDALGFVLQTNTLVPYLKVLENIRLPLRVAHQTIDASWEAHVLNALGLTPLVDRIPSALSVGQRQRVSVARALLGRPALLLLDEPVASLDPANVDQVERLISHLAEEAGSGILLASHQAQTGVFANVRRVGHRVLQHEGITYSLFNDAGSVAAQTGQDMQVAQ
jgi:putative ABC transport system ATP-binding protein